MTKPIQVSVNIPFDGFYNSLYSDAVDSEESQWCDYHGDAGNGETDPDYENAWPKELRVSGDLWDFLFKHTEYNAAYAKIAGWYAAAFDHVAGEALQLSRPDKRKVYNHVTGKMGEEPYTRPSIGLAFEEMTSPREYNFETDRLFATVPLKIMRELFKRSKAEKHATLAAVIRDRFTSYDGFHSYYLNDLESWLEKPLTDWDHNELGTLLIAALKAADFDVHDSDARFQLYESTFGDEGAYQAWSEAVDWPAFEAARREARAEKLAEWRESDPEDAATWLERHPAFASEIGEEPPQSARHPDQLDLPLQHSGQA